MKEFDVVKEFFLPLTNNHNFCQGLIDDVASIEIKESEQLVVSKDVFVEDTHFYQKDGGFNIAAKLLLTNLSDIAASGAKPLCYMLGFSKNRQTNKKFCEQFANGLKTVQNQYKIFLLGGDTVGSKNGLFFSITIFGVAKKGEVLKRSQAEDGDLIFVSGTIGDAGLGLIERKKELTETKNYQKQLIKRHYLPTPRIALGNFLLKNKLSKCAIDVSDGLLSDLRHLSFGSNLTAKIFFDQIPISVSANKFLDANPTHSRLNLLSSGDDYELIFAAQKSKKGQIVELAKSLNISISEIGYFYKTASKPTIELFDSSSNSAPRAIRIKKFGYEH